MLYKDQLFFSKELYLYKMYQRKGIFPQSRKSSEIICWPGNNTLSNLSSIIPEMELMEGSTN